MDVLTDLLMSLTRSQVSVTKVNNNFTNKRLYDKVYENCICIETLYKYTVYKLEYISNDGAKRTGLQKIQFILCKNENFFAKLSSLEKVTDNLHLYEDKPRICSVSLFFNPFCL